MKLKGCMDKIRKFAKDIRGVAYLEFALALPFLLALFAGSVDVTRMVLLHQKVDKAVFMVGDLATQLHAESGVCNTVKGWEENVVKDMLQPFTYDSTKFTFIMSSVLGTYPNNNPRAPAKDMIEWRYNIKNGNLSVIGNFSRPYMQEANLPKEIEGLAASERVIVTEMQYTFSPLIPYWSNLVTNKFHKASFFRSRVTTGREGRNSGVLSGC